MFDLEVVTSDTFLDHTMALMQAGHATGDYDAAADTLLIAAERIGVSFAGGRFAAICNATRNMPTCTKEPREDRAASRLAAWRHAAPVRGPLPGLISSAPASGTGRSGLSGSSSSGQDLLSDPGFATN